MNSSGDENNVVKKCEVPAHSDNYWTKSSVNFAVESDAPHWNLNVSFPLRECVNSLEWGTIRGN